MAFSIIFFTLLLKFSSILNTCPVIEIETRDVMIVKEFKITGENEMCLMMRKNDVYRKVKPKK
jgi:hypothetical protein